MGKNETILQSFTLETLPDLDVVTLGALELFSHTQLPNVAYGTFTRPLVVGSGNAAVAGKLLFDDIDAVFADESSYLQALATVPSIDGVVLISASGSKHAVTIAKDISDRKLPLVLLTNNEQAPAKEFIDPKYVHVFPKNREPYTYNTSTYMGLLFSKTNEDATAIQSHLETEVLPLLPQNFNDYKAFYLILPDVFTSVREMFRTKFDELFGPQLMARVFTYEQTKHAKTVIPHESELFVSFGVDNTLFGKPENRLFIPFPEECDYAGAMATGYFVIGHIQKQLYPYYKERVEAYCKETSEAFGSTISPIVE
jgi:hypothetical protein